jgi:hypothetical protein
MTISAGSERSKHSAWPRRRVDVEDGALLFARMGSLRECPPTTRKVRSLRTPLGTWRAVDGNETATGERLHVRVFPATRGAGMFSIASSARRSTGDIARGAKPAVAIDR